MGWCGELCVSVARCGELRGGVLWCIVVKLRSLIDCAVGIIEFQCDVVCECVLV